MSGEDRVPQKTFLPLLTWVEAQAAAERGAVVLIPVGTVDGNGPHLPTGFDYLVASELARHVAERTNNLWTPPLAFGVSDALKAFPGTIAIPPDILTAQIEAVLTSLIGGGFEHLLLVNNHGPNQYPAEVACRNVRGTHGVVVPAVFPAELVRELGGDLLAGNPEAIGHGSEPGTSLLMHLFPDAVRTDLQGPGARRTFNGLDVLSPTDVRFGDGRIKFFLELEEVSDTGRWGDPATASPELGAALFERLVAFTSEFVEAFAGMDTRVRPPAPRRPDAGSGS